MTYKRIIIISAILLFIALIITIVEYYTPTSIEFATVSKEEKELLCTGDIIFTEGVSFKSDIVRVLSNKGEHKFSHCGIIISDTTETYVVHMSIDEQKIVKEEINSFCTQNTVNSFCVSRVSGAVIDKRFKDAIDSLLKMEIGFDDSYNADNHAELYCSELICMLYEEQCQVNMYPFEERTSYIYPNELYGFSNLKKIL